MFANTCEFVLCTCVVWCNFDKRTEANNSCTCPFQVLHMYASCTRHKTCVNISCFLYNIKIVSISKMLIHRMCTVEPLSPDTPEMRTYTVMRTQRVVRAVHSINGALYNPLKYGHPAIPYCGHTFLPALH